MKKQLFDGYNRLKSKFANMIVEEVKKEPDYKKDLNLIYHLFNRASDEFDEEHITEIAIINGECLVRIHVCNVDGHDEQVVLLHDLPMDELFNIAEHL